MHKQNSVVRYLYSTQLLKYVINSNGKLLRHKQISFGRFIFKSAFVIFFINSSEKQYVKQHVLLYINVILTFERFCGSLKHYQKQCKVDHIRTHNRV